jgi:serine/threonine-protein phosphatase 2A regulatory subunit B
LSILQTEFQSHEPEFDCLKSLEIEEKINMIKFSKRTANGLFLLATNDKTIKYWKVHDKKIRRPVGASASGATSQRVGSGALTIPHSTGHQTITIATLKRVYANAHTYHINSVSINSDGTTFISADDLRVNLWSLDISDTSFNIIDLKPPNLEELTEVITSAIFHPTSCNMLLYTSSRGTIRLCDLRAAAHAESNTKQYECEEDPSTRSFFSEIISSISDAKFTSDGQYIISRDYMTLKIWYVYLQCLYSTLTALIPPSGVCLLTLTGV